MNRTQNRTFRVIANRNKTGNPDILDFRRTISSLVVYFKYFHGLYSKELARLIPPKASLTAYTQSKQSAYT